MSKVNALKTTTPRIPATSSRVERSRTRQGEDARDRCLPRCLKDSCSNIPDACHQNRTRRRQPHYEHREGKLQQRERERRACGRSGTAHHRSNILDIQKQFNGRAKDLDAQGKELDEDQESSRTSWSWNSLNLQPTSSSSSVNWRRTTVFLTRPVSVQSWSTGQLVAKLMDGVSCCCFLFSSTPLTG